MRRSLLLLVALSSALVPAAAQNPAATTGAKRPDQAPPRSLAEGLVRHLIERERLRPPLATSGQEIAAGEGPLALLLRSANGGLTVHPLQRGRGEHGDPATPPRMVAEEVEEEEPVEAKERRAGEAKGKQERRPARPVQLTLRSTGKELTISSGAGPGLSGPGPQRASLVPMLSELHATTAGTTAADRLLIIATADVDMQHVLTTWEIAREVGFRTVGFGGVHGESLSGDDQETIARLPETLAWTKEGLLCDGELLILLDGGARWGDVAPIIVECARAGIWQLAFVGQKDRATRFKIPAHLSVDQ